jgi:hypothetical protein
VVDEEELPIDVPLDWIPVELELPVDLLEPVVDGEDGDLPGVPLLPKRSAKPDLNRSRRPSMPRFLVDLALATFRPFGLAPAGATPAVVTPG